MTRDTIQPEPARDSRLQPRSESSSLLATFLLLCVTLTSSLCAFASAEEPRDEILRLMDGSPDTISLTALRPLYRQPSEIPYRRQKLRNLGAAVELGRELFFDPRLSGGATISCATCHNPSFHWTDSLPRSIENASRRSMALFNLAWDRQFSWSGRVNSLMSQSVLALTAPKGMNVHRDILVTRVKAIAGYSHRFEDAFGGLIPPDHLIGLDTIAYAIELYVASLRSPIAPFDRWVDGADNAITPQAKRGFLLFHGKAQCARCHSTWRFSDGATYDIGLSEDPGRAAFVPEDPRAPFAFKAVGLRNIADRPPYMHDGSMATLADVVEFYNRGGNFNRPSKSPFIRPLGLTALEKAALIAFLESLSGPMNERELPILPR